MESSGTCDGLQLNMRSCNLGAKQLHILANVLSRRHSKFQVKNLDMSDNNLPDEKVADLFRKASTAFRSLEKLYLCNSGVGRKGVTAIMSALAKSSRCLIQLDLSFNPLTLPGLKVLENNVLSGTLLSLEILLLQGSLTKNAKVNIQYLTTFTNSLSINCRNLRKLDISGNDLGEPGSPAISTLIFALTGYNKKFDLHVNREYTSEVDKNFIKTMEDLVRQKGTIDHTVAHGVIVGPGRSGKNSLMNRLMGEGPPDPGIISPSTGVLDNIIKVEVKKLCTVAASVNNLKWKRLDYDEEALELMMTTVKTHIASFFVEEIELESVPECIPELQVDDHIPSALIVVESENESESESDSEIENNNVVPNPNTSVIPKVAKGAVIHVDHEREVSSSDIYSRDFQLHEGPLDVFKRAVKLRRMDALREHLESSWSLYLTNTGGQMEFQELLPLLVCGPSVFFITFPLCKNLHEHYTVQYQYPDGSEKTYPSPCTLMDEILQTLATIAAVDCTGPRSEINLKPKVFFVGTHKDLLPEPSADDMVQQIDMQLQEKIRHTLLFRQGSIEFAVGTNQLMFTVNNLDKDDDDFQKIRSALQKTVERCEEFTIKCPSTWLIFSLVLRAKHKSSQVLSYNDCFAIAKSCGISERAEFNDALFFIHTRLGLLRYFCVEDLNKLVVIDPQILFDTITKLIVKTFISDHAKVNEIEEFQKRGIFSMEVMERISSKSHLDSQLPFKWLLKLLNHLRIAAFFMDNKGKQHCFFPSVLCHAPKQQNVNESDHSIKPPPILIAFESGFCPRAIPGTLIKYLMTNEMKSPIAWKLHASRVFRNQVSFSVGPGDIVLKIHPTHLQICFDPESGTTDLNEMRITCKEAYKQIKQAMNIIIQGFCECNYFFAFYCTKSECEDQPHPAEIEWGTKKLKCKLTDRRSNLPDGYEIWLGLPQSSTYQHVLDERLDQVLDSENGGVPQHLGQIADSMYEWEGPVADKLGLTPADVTAIKTEFPGKLRLQTRAALEKWKQKLGTNATYSNLIGVFKGAGYKDYADTVKYQMISAHTEADTNDFSKNSFSQASMPSIQSSYQSPVFPEPEQFPSLPRFATASAAVLLQEEDQLEYNPGRSTCLKVEKVYESLDVTPSLPEEEPIANSLDMRQHGNMDPSDNKIHNSLESLQLEDESITTLQASGFTSSPMECTQVSDSTNHDTLREQYNEDIDDQYDSIPLENNDSSPTKLKLEPIAKAEWHDISLDLERQGNEDQHKQYSDTKKSSDIDSNWMMDTEDIGDYITEEQIQQHVLSVEKEAIKPPNQSKVYLKQFHLEHADKSTASRVGAHGTISRKEYRKGLMKATIITPHDRSRHTLPSDSMYRVVGRKKHTSLYPKQGTWEYELHKMTRAIRRMSLEELRLSVKVPVYTEYENWMAKHLVDFCNQITVMFRAISESCTDTRCPIMSGGVHQYYWQDETQKIAHTVTAPQYINNLLKWIEKQINDKQIFPPRGTMFSTKFIPACQKMLSKLCHVFAHVYYHHADQIMYIRAKREFEACYLYFYYFVREFNLINSDEMSHLETIYESLLRDQNLMKETTV